MASDVKFRPKGVKRYVVGGVTYTYHKETGVRLPDLPFSDRRFIEALKAANAQQKIKSQSGYQRRSSLAHLTAEISKIKPVETPDAVAYSVPQCAHFVLKAKPGDKLLYHSGDLATDGATDQMIRDRQQYLALVASFELVQLRMARIQEGWSHYYAVRRDEALYGMPMHVIQCDIAPSEYMALLAVDDRQGAQSTTRAIRDALGINDTAAADIRNDMINRGWLANSRPPELTQLGRSLLA